EALAVLSCPAGKPDRAIVAALADAEPRRRAAAAFAVGRSGSKDHVQAVLKLLKDRDADVRTGAALGLALAGAKKAVDALVELVGELPSAKRGHVEDALARLAGNAAPNAPGDDSGESAKKRRDLWAAWWAQNREKVDLSRLVRDVSLGYVLCIIFD